MQQHLRKVGRTTIKGTRPARPHRRFTYVSTRSHDNWAPLTTLPVVDNFNHLWRGNESANIGKIYEIRLPRNILKSREAYQYARLEKPPHSADLFNILDPSSPRSKGHTKSKRSTALSVFATSEQTEYSSAPGTHAGSAPSSGARSRASSLETSRIQDSQ